MTGEVPEQSWADLTSGDPDVSLSARHEIAVHYQFLVEGCARKLESRLPTWIVDDELISAGQLGLLRAIDRYDPGNGTPFRRFASTLIHGAIIDDLRKQDWAPRTLRRSQREIAKARQELSDGDQQPSLSEVAEHLGWEEAQVESVIRKVSSPPISTGGIDPYSEDSDSDIQLVCSLFVRDYRQLSAPVQVVLARIYVEGQTLSEVSTEMGLPLVVVRSLHLEGIRAASTSVQGSLVG